jgi:predicted RNA-binding protein
LNTLRHWLCITMPKNWEIVKQRCEWGVDDRYQITLKKNVSIGDLFIFYVTRTGIAGIYKVASPYYFDDTPIGWINKKGEPYTYPNRVRITQILLPKKPIPFDKEFRQELLFITDKGKTWQVFVFPSMVLIPEDDYHTIRKRLEQG